MSISVSIPKEITDYKEKIIFSLSLRELICLISAIILGTASYAFCTQILDLSSEITGYLVILFSAPLLAVGFIRKDKLPFEKYVAFSNGTLFFHKNNFLMQHSKTTLIFNLRSTKGNSAMFNFLAKKQLNDPKLISSLQTKPSEIENANKPFSTFGLQKKNLNNPVHKQTAPKNTLDIIHYNQMFEDGICEIENGLYSRSFLFSDINYQTAGTEEQESFFLRYCALLNSCSSSVHLQINIFNRRIDKEKFQNNMLIPLTKTEDRLNQYRKEMNTMLAQKALEGQK